MAQTMQPETSYESAMRLSMEIVDRMNEGVGLTRCRDGVVVYGNPAIIRMFGFDPEEVVGNHFTWLLTEEDKAPGGRAEQVVEHLMKYKAWKGEVRGFRKDGSVIWVNLTVTTLNHPEHGEVWMGIYQDITEKKQAQDQLHQEHNTIQAILDASPESAGLLACDGTVLAANATMASRLGSGVDDLVGKWIGGFMPPEVAARRQQRLEEAVGTGKPVRFRDTRDQRVFDTTFCPVLDDAGKVLHVALFSHDVTELAGTMADLELANELYRKAAHTDHLTGLPNRRCFMDALNRELYRVGRYGGQGIVGIIDVDGFKALNDAHGHAFGDRVLVELSTVLRDQLRNSDVVGRYAGDEFTLLMPNACPQGAAAVIDRIRAAMIALAPAPHIAPIPVTFSAGLAMTLAGQSPEDLLHKADGALYAAKAAGRNCTRLAQ